MKKLKKIFGLVNKVALITGGTRGFGESIAELFLDAGAKVVITGRDVATGKDTAIRLGAEGGDISYARQDVASEADWQKVIDHTFNRFSGLDILVNNAGVHWLNTIETETLESFRAMQNVNVNGTFIGLKHAIEAMKPGGRAGQGGAIINISSIGGIVGFVSHGAYGASKGSVRALSKVAAIECAKFGYDIRVNSVHPGVVSTDMAPSMWEEVVSLGMAADHTEAREVVAALHPLGLGEPVDVAAACLYLASDASKWVTGAELMLDGGFTAQ